MKRSSRFLFALFVFFCVAAGNVRPAHAAAIEIRSLRIVPERTTVGSYPDIRGTVEMTKAHEAAGEQVITVIAVLYRPDHVLKSWTWKDVSMRAGEAREFSVPREYEINLPGTYKVDLNVYTRDMRPLRRLSRTFVVDDPVLKTIGATPEKGSAAEGADRRGGPSAEGEERRHLALGFYGNALNPGGGMTLLAWPGEHIGLQATYTEGSFTSAEGRLLLRFPRESGANFYIGAGYVDVSVDKDILGVTTRFRDSGVTGVIGAEYMLGSATRVYAEITGASLDLKKQVENGGMTVNATVEYAPVSIGLGIVFFLF